MKRWYAVIGDPIAQSMSPHMHDTWLRQLQIDAAYIPIHVKRDALQEAVNSLKRLGCSGWNVTVPHKEAIIPLLDEIDPLAKAMGAVNTVVVRNGKLYGSNTDGLGFVRSLREAYEDVTPSHRVLIIGAGGAAKGIAHAMYEEGWTNMTICNRTVEKAEHICAQLRGAVACTIEEAERQLEQYDVLVQTTSVGMAHSVEGSPISVTNIRPGTIVADIIYNPLQTTFMKEAAARGARTMNGIGMFVHQGAIAFERWTGQSPHTEMMTSVITEQLGGTLC